MLPLRDSIPSRTTPVVNYGLIAASVLVFLLQVNHPAGQSSMIERYGMVPLRIQHPGDRIETARPEMVQRDGQFVLVHREGVLAPAAVPDWLTPLTCIFLHGSWLHLIGNLWFLYIFGDNVEDRLGHAGYLVFYLAAGVLASLLHFASEPSSAVPTIGASGAIAGVMGAYLVLYPRATVLTLIPIFVFIDIVVLPAPLFLGIWFLLQLLQGTYSLGSVHSSGIAWWAHIGGFAVGVVVSLLLGREQRPHPQSETTSGFQRRRVFPRPDHRGDNRE